MQKLLRIFFLASIFFCDSCQEPTQKNVPAEKLPEDSVSFFPVTEFIKGQVKEIEDLPVTPLKININGARHDSIWINKKDIIKYAEPFLHPEIDSSSLANLFIGKSFLDQTIDAFTFSYDPKAKLPDSIKLTHWDVYIDPQKNTVLRIYMVKNDSIDSRGVITQLTWVADKWFSIRNIIKTPGGEPEIKEQIFKWDFDE